MIDEKTKEDIEWIENKLARIQEDVKRLKLKFPCSKSAKSLK